MEKHFTWCFLDQPVSRWPPSWMQTHKWPQMRSAEESPSWPTESWTNDCYLKSVSLQLACYAALGNWYTPHTHTHTQHKLSFFPPKMNSFFFFYHIPSKEIWLKWKGFQWPCQWIGALSIHLAYFVTQTLPLNSNFSSQPLCCYYPPMLCPQKLPKKPSLPSAGWTPSYGLCQGSVPATSCWLFSVPTVWWCDSPSITDHWTYCCHSSLVCTDFLLQRGELSTCQILTVSFLPGCSVPLGSDSMLLFFRFILCLRHSWAWEVRQISMSLHIQMTNCKQQKEMVILKNKS